MHLILLPVFFLLGLFLLGWSVYCLVLGEWEAGVMMFVMGAAFTCGMVVSFRRGGWRGDGGFDGGDGG